MAKRHNKVPKPTFVPEPHNLRPGYKRSMVKVAKASQDPPHPIWPYFISVKRDSDGGERVYCKFCRTVHIPTVSWMTYHADDCVPMRDYFSGQPGVVENFDQWYAEEHGEDEPESEVFTDLETQYYKSVIFGNSGIDILKQMMKIKSAEAGAPMTDRAINEFVDICSLYKHINPDIDVDNTPMSSKDAMMSQLREINEEEDVRLDEIHPVTMSVSSWTDSIETIFAVCATQNGEELLLGMYPVNHEDVCAEKVLEVLEEAFETLEKGIQQKVVALVGEISPEVTEACQFFSKNHRRIASLTCVVRGANRAFANVIKDPAFSKTYSEVTEYVQTYSEEYYLAKRAERLGPFNHLPSSPCLKFIRCCDDLVRLKDQFIPMVQNWCVRGRDSRFSARGTDNGGNRPCEALGALNLNLEFWQRAKEFCAIFTPLYDFTVAFQSPTTRLSDAFVEYVKVCDRTMRMVTNSKHFKNAIEIVTSELTATFNDCFGSATTLLALFFDMRYQDVYFFPEKYDMFDDALSDAIYSGHDPEVKRTRLAAFDDVLSHRNSYEIKSSGTTKQLTSFVQKTAERFSEIVPHCEAGDRMFCGFMLLMNQKRGRVDTEELTLRARCVANQKETPQQRAQKTSELLHELKCEVGPRPNYDEDNEDDELRKEMCDRLVHVEDCVKLGEKEEEEDQTTPLSELFDSTHCIFTPANDFFMDDDKELMDI